MRYLGIDPGLRGALAVLDDRERLAIFDTPTVMVRRRKRRRSGQTSMTAVEEYMISEIVQLLRRFSPEADMASHAMLEWNNPRPHESVTSAHKAGVGAGIWLAVLSAVGIPCTKVPPSKWKPAMLSRATGGDKNASTLRAQELFPYAQLVRRNRRDGKGDHNRAEALLLAEFCRRSFNGTLALNLEELEV